MAAVSICSDFRAQQEEISHYCTFPPSIFHEVMGAGCHNLSFFLIFNFNLALSLYSFTLMKKLFSSSSLSAFRMVSSSYLRLLMFPHLSWFQLCHPAWHFSWYAQHTNQTGCQQTALLYSFLDLESISCSIQGSNCCFLICIQVSQETGKMVWYSNLFKSFPQFIMIHTVKGFGIVNKTEVDVCLEFPSFLYDPANVSNFICGSSAFF